MNSTLTIKISEKGENPYNTILLEGGSGLWIIAKTAPGEIEIIKIDKAWRTYCWIKRIINRVKTRMR